jgi:hypothetical protein
MTPKEIRKLRGLPRIVIAVRAGVSEPSVRSYENNPIEGVTPPIKAKLEPIYLELEKGPLKPVSRAERRQRQRDILRAAGLSVDSLGHECGATSGSPRKALGTVLHVGTGSIATWDEHGAFEGDRRK